MVLKFGGTSVGKFAENIARIVEYVTPYGPATHCSFQPHHRASHYLRWKDTAINNTTTTGLATKTTALP